jgi:hypothetical protein
MPHRAPGRATLPLFARAASTRVGLRWVSGRRAGRRPTVVDLQRQREPSLSLISSLAVDNL